MCWTSVVERATSRCAFGRGWSAWTSPRRCCASPQRAGTPKFHGFGRTPCACHSLMNHSMRTAESVGHRTGAARGLARAAAGREVCVAGFWEAGIGNILRLVFRLLADRSADTGTDVLRRSRHARIHPDVVAELPGPTWDQGNDDLARLSRVWLRGILAGIYGNQLRLEAAMIPSVTERLWHTQAVRGFLAVLPPRF